MKMNLNRHLDERTHPHASGRGVGRVAGLLRHACCALALVGGWGTAGAASAQVWQAPELGWVLRATEGSGVVQVLDVRQGIKPLGVLRQAGRSEVLDVRVDAEKRQVWVRSAAGVALHDAYNGRVLRHWAGIEASPFDAHWVQRAGSVAGM
jgi:hypothetical protein